MKKWFKKLFTVSVVVALCLLAASCGGTEKKSALVDSGVKEELSANMETAKEKSGIKDEEDEEKANFDEINDGKGDEPKDSALVSSDSDSKSEYESGVNTEEGFESEFMGIKFKAPEGFTVTPQNVIDEQNKVNASSPEAIVNTMRYEASIVNEEKTMQVIVSVDGDKGGFSEDEYLGGVANSYSSVEGAQVGQSITDMEIAGELYSTIDINLPSDSKILYCVRKKGDEMFNIIFIYPEAQRSEVDSLIKEFKKY